MSALRYVEAATVALLAVFAPIQAMLLTVLALVLADLCFGVVVAVKKKHKITSRGIRRSVTKLLVYESALGLVFLAETFLKLPVPVVSVVATLIAAVELKSLLEHFDALLGGSLFKTVVEALAPQKKE